MFCVTCNLEYPDHLNFCRRCGQTLVRAQGERATESVCCTRCGSRVVQGEKFCQHCGTRVANVTQETVVGICQNCNAYWRSGWQYCKTCGVNSEQALQINMTVGNQPSAAKKNTADIEGSEARSECPSCSALIQPFSLFCDSCGTKLSTETAPEEVVIKDQEPEKLVSQATVAHVAQLDEDSLSRLDDPLLDDPLSQITATGKPMSAVDLAKKRGTGSQLSNLKPFKAESKKAKLAPLRLVEKSRETEFISPTEQIGKAVKGVKANTSARKEVETDSNQPSPTPQSWRAVITPSSEPVNIDFSKATKTATQPLSLFVGETGLSRRPIWHIPFVMGIVLLGSFLLAGIWRKEQSARTVLTNAQRATNQPTAPTNLVPVAPAGMVYVPGGKFQMGREDGTASERPIRTLELKPFFLDRTEVTNQQYWAFIEATGRPAPSHWRVGKPLPNEANLPVVNVTWEEARDFAAWAGKRLPTEEEWEFAARSTDGRLFPWGNTWEPSFANTLEGQMGKIVEVGRNLAGASPYGVVDMCGNVWEWTSSESRAYATQELLEEGVRVIRGGAFDSPKEFATTTYRGAVKIGKPYPKTGFRCAKDLP